MKLYDINDEIKYGKEEIINESTRKYILDEQTEVFCYFFEKNEIMNIIFKKKINIEKKKTLLLHWSIFIKVILFLDIGFILLKNIIQKTHIIMMNNQ